VEEAEATGSEAFVTACPFCLQSLITGIQAADSRLPAVDLTDLLVEKAGFEP
jgi:Fe-S oxidoreductase